MSTDFDYGKIKENGQYEDYPDEIKDKMVQPFRKSYMHLTCGCITTMADRIAMTYATNPGYYGATFCTACRSHYPLNEFVWVEDGEPTDKRISEVG